jgi:DNA-binding MltR family transcriptional regulator
MTKASTATDGMEAFWTSKGESDLGCLLVCLSDISNLLGELLFYKLRVGSEKDATWLLDPLAGNRPLASLAVRTRMARCLRLISGRDQTLIDQMRKLRNKHAHGTQAFKFSKENIAPIVAACPLADSDPINALIKKRPNDGLSVSRIKFMYCHMTQQVDLTFAIKKLKQTPTM